MKVIQRYVVSWLSLSLLFAAVSNSANTRNKTPIREEKSVPTEKNSVEQSPDIAGQPQIQPPTVLDETSPNNFDTAGFSYYDLNSTPRNPRQIAFDPATRNSAIVWAKSPYATLATRNVFASLWINSKTWPEPLCNIPMSPSLSGRGGFAGITCLPRSRRFILYAHHPEAPRGVFLAAEETPGGFDWEDEFPTPDSAAGHTEPGMWPTAAGGFLIDTEDYDGDGSSTDTIEVIHIFSHNGDLTGVPHPHVYARAVDSMGAWIFPGFSAGLGMLTEASNKPTPTVVTSKKSPKVALIYTVYEDSVDAENIYYIESTNGGQDWVNAGSLAPFPRVKVTDYGTANPGYTTGDFMGVYDMNDSLVISFTEYVYYDPLTGGWSQEANIYVWTKQWGKRKAVDGNFDQMPAQAEIPGGTRRLTLNWPHIAVHDGIWNPSRLNYYLMTYVQYGGNSQSEWSNTADNGFLNGEIYLVASTNRGKTWSNPINLTNSRTPGCTLGTCSGVSFASCAEVCNDTVHIAYMSDLYAGSLVYGENTTSQGTNNPVIYMKYPLGFIDCFPVPSFLPSEFILNPEGTRTETLWVYNLICADLVVDSIRLAQNSPWITIDSGVNGFTIPEGGPDFPVIFTVNDAGLSDGVYVDTLKMYTQSPNSPVVRIVVRMVVDNVTPYITPSWKDLDNGVIRLRVSNVGNIGHQNSEAGFYRIIGNDTTNNLFDGTTFMAVVMSNGDTVAGRWIFGSQHMWPLDTLLVFDTTLSSTLQKPGSKVKIPPGDYQVARTAYASFFPFALGVEYPGPWFGFRINEEWWLPRMPDPIWNPSFVLNCQTIEPMNPGPSWWPTTQAFDPNATTVYFGKGLDWDVYGNSDPINFGWAAYGTGLVWQEGSDTTYYEDYGDYIIPYPNGFYAFAAHLDSSDNPDPYSMHIVSNERFIYPAADYVDGELYQMAADTDTNQIKYADSLRYFGVIAPADFNTVLTSVKMTPPFSPTAVVSLVGVVGDSNHSIFGWWGCNILNSTYDSIRNVLGLGGIESLSEKLNCWYPDCIGRPGDANESNTYSLADAIAILNYVFSKTGCNPLPLCWVSGYVCRGDWNGSGTITLGDVVQCVNFIFDKPGGPWYPVAYGLCCIPYGP
ncbi:MAG: hypothetical protein A2Z27_05480 [candidate division Zixibacteria bacterium RBG_16_50_21]|nr:MAG: hypothetical protein A2Z27_05480 [candidate division Zixibacteria bacterium RBG_16_50_21]